jgi:hypothetical protein
VIGEATDAFSVEPGTVRGHTQTQRGESWAKRVTHNNRVGDKSVNQILDLLGTQHVVAQAGAIWPALIADGARCGRHRASKLLCPSTDDLGWILSLASTTLATLWWARRELKWPERGSAVGNAGEQGG